MINYRLDSLEIAFRDTEYLKREKVREVKVWLFRIAVVVVLIVAMGVITYVLSTGGM